MPQYLAKYRRPFWTISPENVIGRMSNLRKCVLYMKPLLICLMTTANTTNMEWMQSISNNHADSDMVKATEIIFRSISWSCCCQTHGPNYCPLINVWKEGKNWDFSYDSMTQMQCQGKAHSKP